MEMQVQRETKACPACGEEILAAAIKCKHCGEQLDGSNRKLVPSLSAEKRKKLAVTGTAALAIALVAGLGWFAFSQIPETKLWVTLHKDVEWHRAWQDARVDDDRTRVADLYRDLSAANPADGNLKYLAIRALPTGRQQLDGFRNAAETFDSNPWVLFGQATAEEENGDWNYASELSTKAIGLFGRDVPGFVLGYTANRMAFYGDIGELKGLYSKYRDTIRASKEASRHMAKVALIRGDLDGAVQWEEHADAIGSKSTAFRALRERANAIGLRPDLIGTADHSTNVMGCEIVDYTVEPVEGGNELRLWLKMSSYFWKGDVSVYPHNAAILPTSGAKIEPPPLLWSKKIPPGNNIKVSIPFVVPASTTVGKFVFDTGLVDRWDSPIILTLNLRPDPSFSVEDPIRP